MTFFYLDPTASSLERARGIALNGSFQVHALGTSLNGKLLPSSEDAAPIFDYTSNVITRADVPEGCIVVAEGHMDAAGLLFSGGEVPKFPVTTSWRTIGNKRSISVIEGGMSRIGAPALV